MAAKIIEPSKGASTCALGNHRCNIYIGVFTKNANIMNIIIGNFVKITLDNINDKFIHIIILNKRGNDAVIV